MPPRPQGRIQILIVLLDGRRVVLEQVGVDAPAHRHSLPIVLPPAPLCHEIQLAGYTSHINVSSPEPCKHNVSVQGQACTLTSTSVHRPNQTLLLPLVGPPRQAQGIQSENLAIKTGAGKPPPRRPFPDLLDMRDAPLCAMSQALVPARASSSLLSVSSLDGAVEKAASPSSPRVKFESRIQIRLSGPAPRLFDFLRRFRKPAATGVEWRKQRQSQLSAGHIPESGPAEHLQDGGVCKLDMQAAPQGLQDGGIGSSRVWGGRLLLLSKGP